MIFVHKNKASFFQFDNLAKYPAIYHGIFTRHFGKSKGSFQSMNVSFGLGDVAEDVRANRWRISRALAGGDLVFAQQVHGDRIIRLNPRNVDSKADMDRVIGIGDALVTNACEKFLTIQVADCQSILLYEPVCRVIANIHSGWRGSIRNIVGKTVRVMQKKFSCNPVHMIAGIGPSLGPCCAEFVNYRDEIPKKFWQFKTAGDHFDFWAISRNQLTDAGVLPENIEGANMCTKCNPETFFSYRGEGQTGRFASVIGLNRKNQPCNHLTRTSRLGRSVNPDLSGDPIEY